jgi:hypothetical protein
MAFGGDVNADVNNEEVGLLKTIGFVELFC